MGMFWTDKWRRIKEGLHMLDHAATVERHSMFEWHWHAIGGRKRVGRRSGIARSWQEARVAAERALREMEE